MDNQINQQFGWQNNANNNPPINSQNQYTQPNPQQDNEMSIDSLKQKYSQMNQQANQQMYQQFNQQVNPQMNQQVNPQMYQQVNPQMYQQGYQQPYGQIPQKKGWDNKYFIYIAGAVALILVLFTMYNIHVSTKPSSDPTIGVSTTEYASEDSSVITPVVSTQEKVETEEKEEESSEAKEAATTETTDTEGSEEKDSSELTNFTPYELPEYDGNSFISHTLAVKFDLPKGYRFYSEQEIDDDSGISKEDFYQGMKEDVDSNKPRTEMFATSNTAGLLELRVMRNIGIKFMRYAGKSDDEIIQTFVEYEDEEKIKENEEEFKNTFTEAKDVTCTVSKEEFVGRPCLARKYVITLSNNATAISKEVTFINGDFNGYIMTMGTSESECDKLISNFTSID